jgi:diadenosine tetraphosphate (Ap4A) HIT family hydrolase
VAFALHPQLAADTITLGDLPACRVLLMNNRHFLWLVLVPRRAALREIFDLSPDESKEVMLEIRAIAQKFSKVTNAHKMNVAALGNMVPQLHIHIIARFAEDAAWPQPVWGAASEPYAPDALAVIVKTITPALGFA